MDQIADRLRTWTPEWTDDERYTALVTFHKGCMVAGPLLVLGSGAVLRAVLLCVYMVVTASQIAYRTCLLRDLERQFSTKTFKSLSTEILRVFGVLSRPASDKSLFTAGVQTAMILWGWSTLLRQSVSWIVGFVASCLIAGLTLALLTRVLPLPDTAALRREDVPSSPGASGASRTPRPAAACTASTGGTA